jgi:hypothetical protein
VPILLLCRSPLENKNLFSPLLKAPTLAFLALPCPHSWVNSEQLETGRSWLPSRKGMNATPKIRGSHPKRTNRICCFGSSKAQALGPRHHADPGLQRKLGSESLPGLATHPQQRIQKEPDSFPVPPGRSGPELVACIDSLERFLE